MAQLLDANGNPIERAVLSEPQTARVAALQQQWIQGQASGLTPAKAARILRQADEGDLLAQHELFDDMIDRDSHLAGEFGKRAGAVVGLDWSIEPPRNASLQEKKAAAWCEEILRDVVDDFEDVITALMEGVGHGFSAVELEWRLDGAERIPVFNPRPQTWLQLSRDRRQLRLRDGSAEGAELWPFGWIMHQPGKVKTGYLGRAGLLRPLVWPWMYRAYALSDFAEYLETYGLPFIVGKYFSAATPEEKASLMRAVTALGHDARAIMPQDMALEIQKITGGGDSTPHLSMMEWAEKAISKLILGATLTTQADGKTSTNALGNVHNEVRQDIRNSDCQQIASTLTRDLIYPMIALNRGGVDGLRRCPRIRFDTGEAEDLKLFADALPALAAGGAKIPVEWVHEKLRIPMAADDEEVFAAPKQPAPPVLPTEPAAPAVAAASQQLGTPAVTTDPTPVTDLAARMATEAQPAMAALMAHVTNLVNGAESLEQLRDQLLGAYGSLDAAALSQVMAAGFAVADLSGHFDVERGE
jgi:phage gp29-like protein